MGGSRYLRSKRLQMQPESLSSRSKVDGEHDTHPNNYQDQDQETTPMRFGSDIAKGLETVANIAPSQMMAKKISAPHNL